MEAAPIQGIDNVGICVRDQRRAVGFCEQLGFEVVGENDRGVTLALGEARLFLFEGRSDPQPAVRELGLSANPPGLDHISFLVADVDALRRGLTSRGIETGGEPSEQEWGARAFGLRDPDANDLYFLQWL
jgi:catechol 2,3-dioxygenase-like lactoylglutathione lyase family enzyme